MKRGARRPMPETAPGAVHRGPTPAGLHDAGGSADGAAAPPARADGRVLAEAVGALYAAISAEPVPRHLSDLAAARRQGRR